MPESLVILIFITVQRLAEMAWARRNETRLANAGAIEVGAGHYPLIVLMHFCWLASLWFWGWDRPVSTPWLIVFIVLQAGRLWVLATLGRRWTARVFVTPGEVLVRRGPYRFVSHPNYLVVALEMPVLPLALNLPWVGLIFGSLNLLMLSWRIRVEGRALRQIAAPRPL